MTNKTTFLIPLSALSRELSRSQSFDQPFTLICCTSQCLPFFFFSPPTSTGRGGKCANLSKFFFASWGVWKGKRKFFAFTSPLCLRPNPKQWHFCTWAHLSQVLLPVVVDVVLVLVIVVVVALTLKLNFSTAIFWCSFRVTKSLPGLDLCCIFNPFPRAFCPLLARCELLRTSFQLKPKDIWAS